METSSISSVEDKPPQHQVFISFRGADLRLKFVSHLVKDLKSNNINLFIDEYEKRGEPTDILLKRIEESKIALVIFSSNYTKSLWCVRELEKIKDCTDEGPLVAIPIFYKVEPSTVRELKGSFGADIDLWSLAKGHERNKKWKEAFNFISKLNGITINEKSVESERVDKIVKAVKTVLTQISSEGSQNAAVDALGNSNAGTSSGGKKHKNFGNEQRLKELEDENSSYAKTNTDLLDRTFTNSRMDGIAFGIKKSLDKLKEKLDLNKISIQLGMKIGCLLLLFFVLQHIAYMMSTRLIGNLGAIDRIVVNVPKMPKYIPAEGIENPKDRCTEFSTGNYGAKPESSSSDAKTNTDLLDRTFTNSGMDGKVKPPKIQVFINFRGDQLRNNFVGYLVDALRRSEINVFIDNQEQRGEDLNTLFKRIEDSGIAIVVFSSRYTESNWCLEELVKIKERVHQGLLKVLPIFYKVTPTNVKRLKGDFGDYFRDKEFRYESDEPMIKRWKEAIVFVSHKFALTFDEKSVLEIDFIETIVKEVLKMLHAISKVESGQPSR